MLFLLCLSGSINGMWFDDISYERAPYSMPLAPMLPPVTTKQERKTRKGRENQELMQYAQQMIAQKENLNNPLAKYGFESCTLLTAAAIHKYHQNIMQFALAHGANINAPDKSGKTALKKAVTDKCASNVTYLLQKGATLDNQKLLSTLCSPASDEIAPSSTHRRVATLKALLDGGADPNETGISSCLLDSLLKHFQGTTYFAIRRPEFQERYVCFLDQRKQMITILLEAGLNPFKKDVKGKSDWEKIIESKSTYDSHLFEFAKKEIEKQKIK